MSTPCHSSMVGSSVGCLRRCQEHAAKKNSQHKGRGGPRKRRLSLRRRRKHETLFPGGEGHKYQAAFTLAPTHIPACDWYMLCGTPYPNDTCQRKPDVREKCWVGTTLSQIVAATVLANTRGSRLHRHTTYIYVPAPSSWPTSRTMPDRNRRGGLPLGPELRPKYPRNGRGAEKMPGRETVPVPQ